MFVQALQKQYQPAVVECLRTAEGLRVTTENVRQLVLYSPAVVDGQALLGPQHRMTFGVFTRTNGKWAADVPAGLIKKTWACGPIDDTFRHPFEVVAPTGAVGTK